MKKLLIITILFSMPVVGMEQPLIFQAIRRGDIEAVRHELRNGAQVDQKYDGETPLIAAVFFRCSEIVALLIEEHADVQRAGRQEQTPLHWAAMNSNDDCYFIELLLKNGADVNQCDGWKRSPFHRVLSKAAAEFLLKNGADINQPDNDGLTKLHLEVSDPGWVEFLLNHGAAMNLQDNDGYTPLHRAIVFNNVDSVRILLKHRADRHIRNKKGETPLDMAQKEHGEDSEMYKLLNSQSLVKGIAL